MFLTQSTLSHQKGLAKLWLGQTGSCRYTFVLFARFVLSNRVPQAVPSQPTAPTLDGAPRRPKNVKNGQKHDF